MGAWWANGRWWRVDRSAGAPQTQAPTSSTPSPHSRLQVPAKRGQMWPNVAKRGQSGRKWPKNVKGSPTGLSSNRKHSSMQTSLQPLMQPTAFLIQRHSNIADVNSHLHTKPLTSHTQSKCSPNFGPNAKCLSDN